jgi:hypothetical protein
VDFEPLRDLDGREVFGVTRAKRNMAYEVVKKMPLSKNKRILAGAIIVLCDPDRPSPELIRRIAGQPKKLHHQVRTELFYPLQTSRNLH